MLTARAVGRRVRAVALALPDSGTLPPYPVAIVFWRPGLDHGPQDLLNRRDALGGLSQAVVPQAHHARGLGDATDLVGGGAPEDEILDLVREHHHLVDADPAPVARARAPRATDRLVEAGPLGKK